MGLQNRLIRNQNNSSGNNLITNSLVNYSNVKWVHVLIEIKPAIFDDRFL